jgi:hypothetical protein
MFLLRPVAERATMSVSAPAGGAEHPEGSQHGRHAE